jgi:hypothetical protein
MQMGKSPKETACPTGNIISAGAAGAGYLCEACAKGEFFNQEWAAAELRPGGHHALGDEPDDGGVFQCGQDFCFIADPPEVLLGAANGDLDGDIGTARKVGSAENLSQ